MQEIEVCPHSASTQKVHQLSVIWLISRINSQHLPKTTSLAAGSNQHTITAKTPNQVQ